MCFLLGGSPGTRSATAKATLRQVHRKVRQDVTQACRCQRRAWQILVSLFRLNTLTHAFTDEYEQGTVFKFAIEKFYCHPESCNFKEIVVLIKNCNVWCILVMAKTCFCFHNCESSVRFFTSTSVSASVTVVGSLLKKICD